MRLLLVAVAATAALLIPSVASAWTPDECAAWYETHGSNHPDCQDYVPPAPPVETTPETPPPVAEQPPAPPVEQAPVVQPPAVTPPSDTPVDDTELIPAPTPKVNGPAPILVKGKEQAPAPEVQPSVETGPTLPFSGLPLGPMLLAGVVLALTGYAARRALKT